ncbi:MAG TPA: MFS transporter, partial [Alphaproteobacteria bacterium]|nr:MFS transporter [Alphaproteobacteria bacterium]
AAPLIGLSFLMVFAPPDGLTGVQLSVWMGVAVFAYFTAMTVFIV